MTEEVQTRNGITAVVVSKGLVPLLELALQHLHAALKVLGNNAEHRVVVVDNASEPPYTREQEDAWAVEGIRYEKHQSFSACCNRGMKDAPNAFYLMINNDVLLHRDALVHMMQHMDKDPLLGICGTRMLFPDGTIQHGGIRFGGEGKGPYHWQRTVPGHLLPRRSQEFQAVTAACMLIRHAVVVELDGFDESYPFAWEDIDFCLRARQAGWRILCSAEVDSLHFESMTPGRLEKDPPSADLFMARWAGKWSIDG